MRPAVCFHWQEADAMAIIDHEELAFMRKQVKKHGGRLSIRTILSRAGWRGVTFDELKQATQLDDAAIKAELGHWMVSHCPGCDYWFISRAMSPILPKGECHLACSCPLGKPLREWRPAFRDNPNRPNGVALREVPLI
jgi:hypothetical protein